MIKYCCDMCGKEIKEKDLKKIPLPLMQYAWAKDCRDAKLMYFEQGVDLEEVEVCDKCITKIAFALKYMGLESKTWHE